MNTFLAYPMKPVTEVLVWRANSALNERWAILLRVRDFSAAHHAGIVFG